MTTDIAAIEIWKPIPMFPEFYEASTDGEIRSAITGNVLRPFLGERGYYRARFYFSGTVKSYTLHRVIALTFLDEDEDKPFVNHIDGDKQNNRLENLEFVSRRENRNHGCIGRSKASGVKYKGTSRFEAHITINKKHKFLGSFQTEHEASKAYLAAALSVGEAKHVITVGVQ